MKDRAKREEDILHAPEDPVLFRKIIENLVCLQAKGLSPGAGVAAAGLAFLGRPYGTNTLEREGPERLILNLRELDCFTFLENAVALERLVRTGATDFADYAAALKRLRYRKGILDGYASRLHYFSDWLGDAEAKGFVRIMTKALGGQHLEKSISYMTHHRESFPALEAAETFRQMREIEERITSELNDFLPREKLREIEDQIQDGDLLAITTSVDGLDVAHVGIALRQRRRVHLLHASRLAGEVLISPETLYGYLRKKKERTGVMVARVT
ncbi:N-acetylmuramoyl-L-alanine amidase-like domain-containing protein [Syntrophus gentianae]|nr:N-acetylmuramoyl-L-alanine amidase-like domain-containing protein [Syntrophus gentianae]